MSEFGGFFNSNDGDRKYKAEDFANYFKSFIGTGINPDSNSLKVVKSSNTQIYIKPGSACILGYLYNLDTNLVKNIAEDSLYRVNLRLDILSRTLNIVVEQGTLSAFPELTRHDTIFELCLAEITVKDKTLTVKDTRGNSSLCGYMAFLGKYDLQNVWNIFNSEWQTKKNIFDRWFANLEGKSPRNTYIQADNPVEATEGDIWIGIL